MPRTLLKNFTIEIEQKLYEKDTPSGLIGVYQTSPFGKLLSINGDVLISEADGFYYYEMMAHPVLFTHTAAHHVLILGNSFGILNEVLKHPNVKKVLCVAENNQTDEAIAQFFSHLYQFNGKDERVTYLYEGPQHWLVKSAQDKFDIIINNRQIDVELAAYQAYYRLLHDDGILAGPCQSSLLHLQKLKMLYQHFKYAGFNDWQVLNFPQPSYPTGLRTVMMATKQPAFKRVREKDIYNRPFITRYYNYDVHKAALVLPEFMREELDVVT